MRLCVRLRAVRARSPLRSFATIARYAPGEPVQLAKGDACSLTRAFTLDDGKHFTALTGDANPIHARAQPTSPFPAPVVHGMLAASLFSALFAQHLPGAVYLSQSLAFTAPVYYDELVAATITVQSVRRARKGGAVVECDTSIIGTVDKAVKISGSARVLLPSVAQQPTAISASEAVH